MVGNTPVKLKDKTEFLFCPRCGLRQPEEIAEYYGGYCPCCGSRTVKNGPLSHLSMNNIQHYWLNNNFLGKG